MRSWKIACGLVLILSFATQGQVELGRYSGKVIGSIEIEGNSRITDSQILLRIRSEVGDLVDQSLLNEDVERIAELEGVLQSYYNLEMVGGKVQVTFVVLEKNLVRSIEFQGNKKFSDKKLLARLSYSVGDYLDAAIAQTGRDLIEAYYKEKGYAFAEVKVSGQELQEGKIVYSIQEGSRVKIAEVKFAGNKDIADDELVRVIKSREKKLYILNNYLQEDVLAEDVEKLESAYYERGHLAVDVEAKTDFNAKRDKVKITFEVNEGPVYTINEIRIRGNEFYSDEKLMEQVKSQEGGVYNRQRLNNDIKRILKVYRERGFVDAAVKGSSPFAAGTEDKVNVEVEITEGQRFRIGRIDISGNEQTQDKVIRLVLDEYDFTPMNWYDAHGAAGDGEGEIEKRVSQITLAKSARILPVESKYAGQKNANVDIVEGQTGSIMLGAGVGTDSGVIGQVVYEERNFDMPTSLDELLSGDYKGAGQNLRVALQPGTVVSEYSVSFSDYYFREKPQSLNVVASNYERGRESYDEERTKLFVGLEKRLKNKYRRNWGVRLENVNVAGVDPTAPSEVVDDKGDNLLAGLRFGIGRDLTDDIYYPSSGYEYNLSYEQVVGDHTFGIVNGVYRRYRTIHEDLAERKTVLSTQLKAGAIVGDAPIFEKFYAGGQRSVRGFNYRGISPRAGVDDDPVGSDWLLTGNVELIKPLVNENFSSIFFVDTAMVETGGVRASVGTGLQILIPQWFGPVPMRFELAMPVMKNGDDDTQIFSFSIGRLF